MIEWDGGRSVHELGEWRISGTLLVGDTYITSSRHFDAANPIGANAIIAISQIIEAELRGWERPVQ